MPNGKTHAIITIATSAAMFSISNYYSPELPISLSLTIGGLIGLILHPDLDQSESRKGLWHKIWWFYGEMIPHRAIMSHFPVISTFGRLLYLLGIPFFILWWYYPIEKTKYFYLLPYIIIGLIIVDTNHFLADIISTKIKRSLNASKILSIFKK